MMYAAQSPDWVLMDLRLKRVGDSRSGALSKTRFPGTRMVILSR